MAYFDTSTWNDLLDHPKSADIKDGLRARKIDVIASIFCAAEIAQTDNSDRRRRLARLILDLHGTGPLLEHPMTMAAPVATALLKGETSFVMRGLRQSDDLLRFLESPDDEEARQEYMRWIARLTGGFLGVVETMKLSSPDAPGRALDPDVVKSDAMLETLVKFEPAKDAGLTLDQMRLICSSPCDSIWTALAGLWAYTVDTANQTAALQSTYGKRRPNAPDLWPTLYFGTPITIFVAGDERLVRAAGSISALLRFPRQVLTSEDFFRTVLTPP